MLQEHVAMATIATPVASTGCDDILTLWKGLVQATPSTRTLEFLQAV